MKDSIRVKFWLKASFVMALLCFSMNVAFADGFGFRCKAKVVMIGDTTSEVKKKCGLPADEENIGYVKVDDEYVNLKRYTYDLGTGKFLRILDFHNGELAKVKDGPRS